MDDTMFAILEKRLAAIQKQNEELLKQNYVQNCLQFYAATQDERYLQEAQSKFGVQVGYSQQTENPFTK